MKVKVSRKEHFNAAHRLYNPDWTDEQNDKVFGKCNNPNFHGHNYELIVQVTGVPEPKTGFVMDMKEMSDIIQSEIIERFDHRNLNEEVDFLRGINPSTENLVIAFWNEIEPHITSGKLHRVRLYETPRNFADYCGPDA